MPELVAPAVKAAKDLGQKVRLMFQDEARFGRMAKIRKCWTGDERPVAVNGYERQFTYVYGACSPQDGAYESMICEKMNTDNMGKFLEQVRTAHPDEQIVMVLDGASSHRAKDLIVPEGIHCNWLAQFWHLHSHIGGLPTKEPSQSFYSIYASHLHGDQNGLHHTVGPGSSIVL